MLKIFVSLWLIFSMLNANALVYVQGSQDDSVVAEYKNKVNSSLSAITAAQNAELAAKSLKNFSNLNNINLSCTSCGDEDKKKILDYMSEVDQDLVEQFSKTYTNIQDGSNQYKNIDDILSIATADPAMALAALQLSTLRVQQKMSATLIQIQMQQTQMQQKQLIQEKMQNSLAKDIGSGFTNPGL